MVSINVCVFVIGSDFAEALPLAEMIKMIDPDLAVTCFTTPDRDGLLGGLKKLLRSLVGTDGVVLMMNQQWVIGTADFMCTHNLARRRPVIIWWPAPRRRAPLRLNDLSQCVNAAAKLSRGVYLLTGARTDETAEIVPVDSSSTVRFIKAPGRFVVD